jgi:transposase
MRLFIGIDVSKGTLDVCLLRENGKRFKKVFANDPVGFAKLLRWITSLLGETTSEALHFCLEATGTYSQGIATFLSEAGYLVSVVNPFLVKHYAQGAGLRNKTDRVDASTIADYCQKHHPAPWRMSAPEVRLLVALLRRLANLQETLQQETHRLGEPGVLAQVQHSLKQSIGFLQGQIEQLKQQIDRHINQHPSLKEDQELLQSIPGIGQITAWWVLAELPDIKQFPDAKSAAAFAGLSPQEYQSGTSVRKRTRLSKAGSRHLRKALYLPAVTATRHNPFVKDLFDRLVAKGKPKMVAIGAAMRKLLMIAYGVLKSRQKFTTAAIQNAA